MKTFIDFLVGHPVILAIAVVVSIIIILSFARKIIRLALVLLAAAVLYVAWLTWHGENAVEKAEKAKAKATQAIQKGKGAVKFIDGLRKLEDDGKGHDTTRHK